MANVTDRFAALPTGVKIFSVMTLALLPLGLIALFASLAAARTADFQRTANLRTAALESARQLGFELVADVTAMRRAANETALALRNDDVCTRLSATFAARAQRAAQFAVFGIASAPVCASAGFVPPRPSTIDPARPPEAKLDANSLDIVVPAARGGAIVIVRYPASTLAAFSQPSTLTAPFATSLSDDRSSLPLRVPTPGPLVTAETFSAPVGLFGLRFSVSAAAAPIGTTEAFLPFLPLLMWASAALIAFVIVDRLLIRPLDGLRRAVASHGPGTAFQIPEMRTPAREIRELGETFATFVAAISQHEQQMAKALADQTKATREVHHRVKNNLQVIASLISLHARGAQAPDAITAYATIQRRVDALSIVHRNHYAGLDSSDGIDVKGLLTELAANLRATASGLPTAPAIFIDAARFGVSQDNAVAIAFLITEIVELSMGLDAAAEITIGASDSEAPMKARLTVISSALVATPALTTRLSGRYARVLEGLSRQLRAPLIHGEKTGRFEIDFAILRQPL